MQDSDKTRDQLVQELEQLRRQVSHLESAALKEPSDNIEMLEEISRQDQAERALKDSEQLHRRLSQVTFEGIAFHEGGLILHANRQYYEMFGYSDEGPSGRRAIPLSPAPESLDMVKDYIESGRTEPYEAVGSRK